MRDENNLNMRDENNLNVHILDHTHATTMFMRVSIT